MNLGQRSIQTVVLAKFFQNRPVARHGGAGRRVLHSRRQRCRDVRFEHLGKQLLRVGFFRSHPNASIGCLATPMLAGRALGVESPRLAPGRGQPFALAAPQNFLPAGVTFFGFDLCPPVTGRAA